MSASANRIELRPSARSWRIGVNLAVVGAVFSAILCSALPAATFAAIPLLCAQLIRQSSSARPSVLLLSSRTDQLTLDQTTYTLVNHAVIAAAVGLTFKDGDGMRKHLLLGSWNSSTEDRRIVRLWLARHGQGLSS